MGKWDNRFIELALHIAEWSKDKHRKVGSVIVDDENRVLSIGYNGFPTGCDDNIDERYERPLKYEFTEHSERNCIYNAARIGLSVKDKIMYVTLFPCIDCARAIIQSGIKKLITYKPDFEDERWGLIFFKSEKLLLECNVEIVYL